MRLWSSTEGRETKKKKKKKIQIFSFRLRSCLMLSPYGNLCLSVNLCKISLLAYAQLCKQTPHVLADRRDEGLLNLFLCFLIEMVFS